MNQNWVLILSCLLIYGCSEPDNGTGSYRADFSLLPTQLKKSETELGVFGGSGRKRLNAIDTQAVSFEIIQKELLLDFDSGGYFRVLPITLGLPEQWPMVNSISMHLWVEEPTALLFELFGTRSRIQDSLSLKKGDNRITIDTREIPLLGGIDDEVLQLKWTASKAGQLLIKELALNQEKQRIPLVDQWGQRRLSSYRSKVEQNHGLHTLDSENKFLNGLSFDFALDEYGGIADHDLPLKTTGFFHAEQIGQNWFLVTPEGNPFYSFGLNGVRRKSTLNNAALTLVKGREWLFEKIPNYDECPACFSPDSAYLSFYCKNVTDKYDNYREWKTQTSKRLRILGLNTIGNWSDRLFFGGGLPYTYTLDTRVFTGLLAGGNLPDVFHPEWAVRVDSAFAHISNLAADDHLLGYFVDNEMPWGRIARPDTASATFEALRNITDPEQRKTAFAAQYFSVIKKVLQKYDPNHLYLGCRFTRKLKNHRAIATVAADYLDVLSVNVYSPFTRQEMDEWYETVKRPILIGEHHIPPITKRALLPRYPAFTISRRNEMVRKYLDTWITYPYAVGSHWYQYVDQEVAGRAEGGENQPVGLVSVTDQIHRELAMVFHGFAQTIPEQYLGR